MKTDCETLRDQLFNLALDRMIQQAQITCYEKELEEIKKLITLFRKEII